MTLALRLFVLAVIGAILAWAMSLLLWNGSTAVPAPLAEKVSSDVPSSTRPVEGVYEAKGKDGTYRLYLQKDNKVRLEFTDKKSRHFGYRGELVDWKISWTQQLRDKKWVDLKQPVDDILSDVTPKTFSLREGRFTRVTK